MRRTALVFFAITLVFRQAASGRIKKLRDTGERIAVPGMPSALRAGT